MKNKIMFRLFFYFAVSFVVFAIVIGIIFSVLFSNHNAEIHKAQLERRAVGIADTLSEMIQVDMRRGMGHGMVPGHGRHGMMQGYGHHGMMQGGIGAYLGFIEDIAMSDVWIVDRYLNQITFGRRHMRLAGITYGDLPAGAERIVSDAFDGRTSVSEVFSAFLETPTITVATPIFAGGDAVGVVLLHSHMADINDATDGGLLILFISMTVAVFVSFFVAAALSSHFTKPLGKMKKAAFLISGGDYSARTGVNQSDEIGKLAEVLDDMAGKLAASAQEGAKLDQLRRDFVANISHELRTPVTVIRGSLEAICDGVVTDPAKMEQYNRQMLSESVYLERLVSDLLDLARLQNPDFETEKCDVSLKDVTDDVVRSMGRIAEQKGVGIDFTTKDTGQSDADARHMAADARQNDVESELTADHRDFLVNGDYGRLRQMLIIVLDNAIKFSPAGGTVKIALQHTEHTKAENVESGKTVNLTISDEGPGIPSDDIPYIFERFYKERSEQNKTGTGLGLAIAKQIADRHDAKITVKNGTDKGAEFTFTFPAKTA